MRFVLTLVLSTSILTATSTTAATFSASTGAASGLVLTSGPTDQKSYTGPAPGHVSSSSGTSMADVAYPSGGWSAEGLATSTARANAGGLHLSAMAGGSVINNKYWYGFEGAGSGRSSADGRFTDSFVLSALGCTSPLCALGAIGSMTVALDITGSLDAGGSITTESGSVTNGGWNASATWYGSMSVAGGGGGSSASWSGGQTYATSEQGSNRTGVNVSYPLAPFGRQVLTFNVVFGQPVFVDIFGSVAAEGGAKADSYHFTNASGGAHANLANTFAWGGILGLFDSNGGMISDFTALSADTGFDYRLAYGADLSAVPAPAALWLLASGLAGIAAMRLRRGALSPRKVPALSARMS